MAGPPEDEDLDPISYVAEFQERYRLNYGAPPVHLSHWDPDLQYRRWIARTLAFPTADDPIRYFFTYELDQIKRAIATLLGLSDGVGVRLLTNSSTATMMCVLNWLRLVGVRHIVLLAPYYFATRYACRALGLTYEVVPMQRTEQGTYALPSLNELSSDWALVVTNPVYSTGVYLGQDTPIRQFLNAGGYVILDETLALHPLSLGTRLATSDRCVAIYSPHKTLNINGVKFSFVLGTADCEDALEQWADVIAGGLTTSAVMAIRHFLSTNFSDCSKQFERFTRASYARLSRAVDECGGVFDHWTAGNFASCYFTATPGALASDKDFLWSVTERTSAVFFPTVTNDADSEWGFGFRVNLTRYSEQLTAAISRVGRVLSESEPP